MNNTWNRVIYKAWAPFYDRVFNKGMFREAREAIFQRQLFSRSKRVLYVGVGTGADLAFLPSNKELKITAIDYSQDMLAQAAKHHQRKNIIFTQMDAQQLAFADESFDTIVASLILSVVPDADRAFQEMIRVLEKGGQIIIFDKFAPKGGKLSFVKKMMRPFISLAGTDIGLSFEKLVYPHRHAAEVFEDEDIMLGDMYRYIHLKKR
ncbi:class I SAM-dependent methyltransferase [Fictibacillus iocasae]|uniref:Class I SAM-dependent methyltransferase n=1 Tax=Fictibacillus iocasae TaxID=2715437 RepID=A0ABW2NNT5_9BACL